MSLYQRVVLVNTAALILAALALLLTPLTVSFPAAPAEIAIVAAGVAAVAALNRVVIRQVFEPLHQLSELASRVDPLVPGRRMPTDMSDREVRELATSFNAMLERLESERRESGRAAVRGQEAERRRIARELHDEVSQTLTAVLLEVEAAGRDAPQALAPRLVGVRESTREALEELRAIAAGLRPGSLDDLGLRAALLGLASTHAARTGHRVSRALPDHLDALGDELELTVYRVAQEGLRNVERHSGARRVELRLDVGRDIMLSVVDDGRGVGDAREGEGVCGMRERARLAGGTLELVPGVAGHGARLALRIPVG